jgi:hypothetical protein
MSEPKCATCKNRFDFSRYDYSHGGCEHTDMDAFCSWGERRSE